MPRINIDTKNDTPVGYRRVAPCSVADLIKKGWSVVETDKNHFDSFVKKGVMLKTA